MLAGGDSPNSFPEGLDSVVIFEPSNIFFVENKMFSLCLSITSMSFDRALIQCSPSAQFSLMRIATTSWRNSGKYAWNNFHDPGLLKQHNELTLQKVVDIAISSG